MGRVALDDWKLGDFVYMPLKKHAQKGILVSGASGSGKTIAAKVIVEELLQEHVPVVVFDYTNQWQRIFEKNTEPGMLERYRLFGMKRTPKAFLGSVVKELPSTSETLQNEYLVLDLSSILETDERVGRVAKVLDGILEYFQTQADSQLSKKRIYGRQRRYQSTQRASRTELLGFSERKESATSIPQCVPQ